jgi:hypothetical protein
MWDTRSYEERSKTSSDASPSDVTTAALRAAFMTMMCGPRPDGTVLSIAWASVLTIEIDESALLSTQTCLPSGVSAS